MAINFPNSPSVNDIHVSGANRWQWNGSSWTRIGGVNSDSDTINSTNDNSTTTLYPVMVSGTGDQTAKIATTANKNLKFNAAEGDLTVGGDISGINANLTGILTASQYNSITAPGANITGVATALQLKGPLTSSGINVTGVSTFSGNVTVGGILTYEDVKNVDSIGLGTFRNGVVVKTGTATTALIVEGDARITGILTVGTGSLVITDKDINATGIITGANFKSGTTNVHNVGVEAAGINVLGADTPIGTGATVYNSGLFVGKQGAEFQGVVTASSFKGSGADLTDVISGIGIGTESGIVGYAATIVHFKGPGVSTAYYSATTGVGTVYFQGGGGSASVSISESAPSSPSAGDMWWDSDVGNLQIYYTDANSSQWVTANNSGPQGPQGAAGAAGAQGAQGHQGVQGSVGIASLTISTGAPSSPAQGDMWWDSDDANLSIYYNDGNSSQWVNINAGPAGAQGAQGAQGVQGAQGHQGVQGAQGHQGVQGAQGHQGVQGATGSNASVANAGNDRVVTSVSGTNLNAEANMQFDGTDLFIPSAIKHLGDPDNHISFSGTDLQLFTTAGSGRMRITDGGVIEMGTCIGMSGHDGNQRLRVGRANDCNLSIRVTGDTTSHTGIDFGDSADDRSGRIQYMHNGDYMSFHTNGAGSGASNERVRIHSDGNVTIGNDAAGAGSWWGDLVVANTNGAAITVGDTGSSEKFTIAANGDINLYSYKNGDNISFHTTDGSGTTQRLRITSGGNIGIGTGNPQDYDGGAESLVVCGPGNTLGQSGITIVSGSDKYGCLYFADGTGSASYRGRVEYRHDIDVLQMGAGAAHGDLVLDASGNLFLRGATTIRIALGSSGDSGYPTNNNTNWIRGSGTNVQVNTCGGYHAWEVSGSQKMMLEADGDLVLDAKTQCRVTLGDAGTPGGNDSNWVRGDGNNLMFNCATSSAEHIFEVAGTAKARISASKGVRAENTCKAWVCYKHDGGVSAIHDDFYVTSVSDEGTGIFSINFEGDMGTEDAIAYQVGSHSQTPVTVGGVAYTPSYGSQNPWWSMEDDWVRINLQKVSDSGNTYTDSEWWNLIAFGDAI